MVDRITMFARSKMKTVALGELVAQGIQAERGENRSVVLVVDGEQAVADTIVEILQRSDFCATAAYRAETALEYAATVPPDLMIIDVLLPDMDGVELATIMKKGYPACRVLLLTTNPGTPEVLEKARADGFHFPVLMKPMYPDDLLFAMAGSDGASWRKRQFN